MKKSTTKRALFLSFVSMFLCFTMLLGTTYAWFTDSVTSGVNQIVAGNLDIELYHTNETDTNEPVTETVTLFDKVEKWEPGAMVWEKFTVKNEGNLALKYQFSLNADNATVVNDATGNPVSFAEMLKVAFLPATDYPNFTPSRDAVKALDASVWSNLESFVEPGNLAEGEEAVYTVVIYWLPSDNDNLFNMNVADANGNKGKVSVDLGVKLFATQVEAESDSFDEFYDKDAAFPKVLETVTVNKGVEQTVSTPYGSVTFATDANTTATDVTVSIEQKDVAEDGNFVVNTNEGAKVFDISVKDSNGDSVDAGFNFFVGKNLDITGFTHYPENGTPENVTNNYDSTTGYMSFEANNGYSPFVLTYKYEGGLGTEEAPYVIANEDQLVAAVGESAYYVLAKDITVNAGVSFVVPAGAEVTLDLNGKTITGLDNATKSFGLFTNKGTFTVKDSVGGGKITLVAENNRAWNAYSSVISNQPGGKFTLKSGIIEHLGGTDMAYGIDNLTNGKGTYAETVVNGGTVKSPYRAIRMFLNGIEAQNILTVNAGTIEGTNKSIWMQDPSANANTGTLTVAAEASLIGDVNLTVTEGSTTWPVTVSINAGALKNGAEVLSSNVPKGSRVELIDGCYVVVSDFAGGSGTAEDPYIISNANQLMNIAKYYDEYNYYKVADGVNTIDCAGWPKKIKLNGSFDGNGVTINNLSYSLFHTVGVSGKSDDIVIKNFTANMNNNEGSALVRNIYSSGKTTFENVTLHGIIEGSYNMGSFYNYGTANSSVSDGADYAVEFNNAKSDLTLICTTGNAIGGMLGHGFEGSGKVLSITMDENSAYTGKMYTTGTATCYQVMAMCSNSTYVLNGQTVSRYDNKYDSTKLVTVLPVKGENGYTIEKQEGVSYYVVSVHGQVDEYFADGTANPNGAGITLVLDSTKVENPGADVLENVESVAIVNEYIDGSFGYSIENGVLKAYVGNRNSHSGTIRLQVTQYDANDNIVATGIIALGTVAKN